MSTPAAAMPFAPSKLHGYNVFLFFTFHSLAPATHCDVVSSKVGLSVHLHLSYAHKGNQCYERLLYIILKLYLDGNIPLTLQDDIRKLY